MEKEEGLKIKINDIDKFLLTRVERYFAEQRFEDRSREVRHGKF